MLVVTVTTLVFKDFVVICCIFFYYPHGPTIYTFCTDPQFYFCYYYINDKFD